jgi:hypothetical protein
MIRMSHHQEAKETYDHLRNHWQHTPGSGPSFPIRSPSTRTFINSWEDRRVVEAVKNTGRKK